MRHAADQSICKKYFVLGSKEIRRPFPINAAYQFLRRKESSRTANAIGKRQPALSDTRPDIRRLLGPVKHIARMGGLGAATNATITPELDAFLSDFKPDVVHTGLGNLAFIRLAGAIRRRYGTA
ncbi:MAG: hypothetical protein ACKVG0_13525, partial [Alphaproteobacteria bacterium]